MANRDFITVEELNYYINNVFLNEELLHNVPVVGEVSGLSIRGEHCYFILKDEKAQISVVFFNCKGRYIPDNGAKVLVRGSINFYQKGGQINVKAYEIIYFGAGLLHLKFEELKKKLEDEGLFREDHKREIPKYPTNVAIITSTKGAAVQDFLTTVRRYNSLVNITIIDVRVQGESCATDIVTALNNADDYGYDVIILARGGGSYEDLFCFNDENIVRTIYNMHTPLISAIGHETDYTLCDFVADMRAITPTAAGELIGYSCEEMRKNVSKIIADISSLANDLFEKKVEDFVDICDDMHIYISSMINNQIIKIKNMLENIKIYENQAIMTKEEKIKQILFNLERLNPLQLLNNGYFRILKDDKYIFRIKDISKNDTIKIIGIDGEIEATVLSKKEKE